MNPMIIPLIIGTAVAATVTLVVWLVHYFTVNACRKELRAYKDQVVTLSDKIDALKERHKLLPQTDRDFVVPMSGETLAAYNAVAARLEHHREVWLKLMDVWEQVQTLLETEWFLGSKRARLARRNLRAAGAPTAFSTVLGDCEAPLDRIEQAHAQAATELKLYQQENQQLGSQLESVAAASLSITAYQPERLAAASLVEQSHGLLPGDPLATLRHLGEARGKIAAVMRRAAKILEQAIAANELMKTLVDIERAATQRRSQGFLLQEEGSNPDQVLADVRLQHAAVLESLNQANETAAGSQLSKSTALLEQARQGLEQHVAAKARCESEIPARQAESRRLADLHALARGQYAELARDFAAATWLGVSENVQRGAASLGAADQYTADAARHAMSSVQRYTLACKLLDQAAENHRHVQAELTAVGSRLRELVELRTTFQSRMGQVSNRADQVQHLLHSNSADRASANERYRGARQSLDRLLGESRQSRPDWTQLTGRLREIETDLDRVEKLAKEDIQLAQQASAEIAETERLIREARAYQEAGITADVSMADSQLYQARDCLTSQNYEEAIRLANAAEQMARTAHQDAISRAQRRQQELESQRRAAEAAAIAAPQLHVEPELS